MNCDHLHKLHDKLKSLSAEEFIKLIDNTKIPQETINGYAFLEQALLCPYVSPVNTCCVCGTTENLHADGIYGWRCDSYKCVCF